jgi:3D (Asp-Asp-Asp) domain-containing protein
MHRKLNPTILESFSADELSSSSQIQPFCKRTNKGGKSLCLIAVCFLIALLCNPADTEMKAQAYSLGKSKKNHEVTVTAYTNLPCCTNNNPNLTASSLRIKPHHYGRIIALSRDLAKEYSFGDRFHLLVNGETHVVEFQDVMSKRHRNKIDFLLPSKQKALKFGKARGILIPLNSADTKSAKPGNG